MMAAISERVALEAEVLVLSGTAGSAPGASAGKPAVVEVRNWMPGKVALAKRALAELLYTVPMFVALLAKLRRGDVALTVSAPPSCCLTGSPPPRN
jgi:colanic acid biosynthesis glycosyl transferase WcaI